MLQSPFSLLAQRGWLIILFLLPTHFTWGQSLPPKRDDDSIAKKQDAADTVEKRIIDANRNVIPVSPQPEVAPKPKHAIASTPDKEALNEIKGLRSRLGSVSDRLPGALSGQADQIFAQEWQRLNQQAQQTKVIADQLLQANPQIRGLSTNPNAKRTGNPELKHPLSNLPNTRRPTMGSQFPGVRTLGKTNANANTLRRAARRLEETAAELEESGLYSHADELRDIARRYWQQAR